jgi:hypothetical protein
MGSGRNRKARGLLGSRKTRRAHTKLATSTIKTTRPRPWTRLKAAAK